MEVTDYTTNDGRGQLQHLRRMIARAVTESRGNAAKVAWLDTVLGEVAAVVTADSVLTLGDLTSDTVSNNTMPDLVHELLQHTSEASTYGGDYKTQLLQDIVDARAILTA